MEVVKLNRKVKTIFSLISRRRILMNNVSPQSRKLNTSEEFENLEYNIKS